jgi:signal transduction histidine kinase
MDQSYESHGFRGGYLICMLILIVVVARGITNYWDSPIFIPLILLLGTFVLLFLSEKLISDHLRWYHILYFPVQAGLVWGLGSLRPFLDVFNFLYTILSIQIIHTFSRRLAVGWMILFAIMLTTNLVLGLGWVEGIVLSLSYLAGLFFLVSYDMLYMQAQSDEAESQVLLAELQGAHQKLQEYVARGEELAEARERNRLARQLHDSVSQVIFSMDLTAQSARLLLTRDPKQVPEQLDRLQEMAASALSDLRSLIAQLRPPQTS